MTERFIPRVGEIVEVHVTQYVKGGVERFWRRAKVKARSIRGVSVQFLDGTTAGVEIDRIRPRKREEDSR